MADTTFINGVTLTDADWFNDVNRLHYTIFGDPADDAAARTNLGLGALAVLSTVGAAQIDDEAVTEPKLAAGISRPSEVRQTVLTAKTNSSGYADFIEAGTGLQVKRMCATVAGVFSFAAGYSSAGEANYIARITADNTNAYGTLAASNTSFLHETYVDSSNVTGGACLIPPQYGYAFDKSENALLNFEGSNGATSTTDDFGNTWTLSGATISTTQAKFGSSSLRLGSGSDAATCTGITSMGDGSWTIQGWFRPDTGAVAQVYFCGYDASGTYGIQLQTSGSGALQLYLSSTGSSWDVSGGSLGSTALANGTWYRIRLTFDALAGTYRVYLSNNGAAETQEITVSSTARIIGLTSFYVGRPAGSGIIGYVDGFQLIRCATNTSTETPSVSAPAITDYPVHFFSIPDMKMYEVTAASATAGTNPTLTARNRIFVGEADTNGSGVSAMRNYALRGQYDSGLVGTIPTTQTTVSFNHNIGTKRVEYDQYVECVGPGSSSFTVGQRTRWYGYQGGVGVSLVETNTLSRNTARYQTGYNDTYLLDATGGGWGTVSGSVNFKYGLSARRTF